MPLAHAVVVLTPAGPCYQGNPGDPPVTRTREPEDPEVPPVTCRGWESVANVRNSVIQSQHAQNFGVRQEGIVPMSRETSSDIINQRLCDGLLERRCSRGRSSVVDRRA